MPISEYTDEELQAIAGEKKPDLSLVPDTDLENIAYGSISKAPELGRWDKIMNFFDNPQEEAAKATMAIVDSETFKISPSRAMELRESIDRGVEINPTAAMRRSTVFDRINQSWEVGKKQNQQSEIGYHFVMTGDPKYFDAMQKIHIPDETEVFVPESRLEEVVRSAAKLLPMMVDTALEGGTKGVTLGMSFGLISALAGQPELIIPMTKLGFTVGSVEGGFESALRKEAGGAVQEIMRFKDDKGNPIDPNIARAAAFGIGTINAGIEMAQLKTLLNTIPGAKKLFSEVIEDVVLNKTVKQKLFDLAKMYAGTVATETGQEIAQESTNIIFEEISKSVNNKLKGSKIDPATINDITKRLYDTAVESAQGFAVIALPGVSANVPGAVKGEAQAVKPEVAPTDNLQSQLDTMFKPKPVTTEAQVTPVAATEAQPITETAKPIITADELYAEAERLIKTQEYEKVFDILDDQIAQDAILRQSPQEFQSLKDRLRQEEQSALVQSDPAKLDAIEMYLQRLDQIRSEEKPEYQKASSPSINDEAVRPIKGRDGEYYWYAEQGSRRIFDSDGADVTDWFAGRTNVKPVIQQAQPVQTETPVAPIDIQAQQAKLKETGTSLTEGFTLAAPESRFVKGKQPVQTAGLFTKEAFMDKLTEKEVKSQFTGEQAEVLAGQLGIPITETNLSLDERVKILKRTGQKEAAVKLKRTGTPAHQVPFNPQKHSLSYWIKIKMGINYNAETSLKGELYMIRGEKGGQWLVNKKGEGLTLDVMREAAIENGFLPEDATVNDLLDAILKDLRATDEMGKVWSYRKEYDFDSLAPGETDFTLDFLGLQSIYESLNRFAKSGKPQAGFQDLLDLGKHIYDSGKVKASDFITTMKLYLGDLWNTFKPYVLDVWNETKRLAKSQEGSIINPLAKGEPTKVEQVSDYLKQNKIEATDEQLTELGLSEQEISEVRLALTEPILTRKEVTAPLTEEAITDFSKPKSDRVQNLKDSLDEYIGVVSTRIKNINERLLDRLRLHVFAKNMKVFDDTELVTPFIRKFQTLDKAAKFKLTKALNNGTMTEVERIMSENNMLDTLPAIQQFIKDIRQRGIEVGFEMGDITDYFPRIVNNVRGLLTELRQGKDWSAIDAAIKAIEDERKETLTNEQKVQVADLMLRGFPQGKINLSEPYTDPTHKKERKIKILSDTLNQYYLPADKALLAYIHTMNGAIENRRFFGKVKTITEKELPLFEYYSLFVGDKKETVESIGKLVMELKGEGELSGDQELELREILQAIFQPKSTSETVQFIKNVVYATTLSNVGSSITQIQDLALAAEKNGYMRTTAAVSKVVSGTQEIRLKDIALSDTIIHEIEQMGANKILANILTVTGFKAADRLGKEALLNGSLMKFREFVNSNNKAFTEKVNRIFGDQAQEVLNDLKEGNNSYNVKFLLFNELSDIQPISVLEVPQKYLTSDKGKLFYALKTYQIKLLDVYRNEIYNEINSGDAQRRNDGYKKLITLTSSLVLLGAGTDWLKDFIFGRKVDWSDLLIDNLLKLGGISKFTTWQARKEGGWTALWKTVSPPLGIIDDVLFKDIIGKGIIQHTGIDPIMFKKATPAEMKALRTKDFEFPKYIPVGGKLYYWWFGEGERRESKKQSKGHKKFKP